ncbi:MAG: hypothetical protein ABI759_09825 [Candidatus Solibacter sp.]
MDTRTKIVGAERIPAGCTVVTGTFDIMVAEDARELAGIREQQSGRPVCVVVLPLSGALLAQRARAELVAALRVVDYVVIADNPAPGPLLDALQPACVVRLEGVHERRKRQLMEHVHSRQTR